MKISEAVSRTDNKLKCRNTTFEKLAKRIKENPVIGSETYEEYLKLDQDSQTQKKDVGGFVLGKFQGGKRSNSSLISRSGLSLDLDKIGSYENYQAIVEKLNLLCCNYCLYSTRKSTKNNPRVRILIELSRDITPDEYVYISREICYLLGMEYCDPVSARPAQLMFYPSISSDMKEDYDFLYQEELRCSPLDPDILLSQNESWKSIPSLKKFPGEDNRKIHLNDKKTDYIDPREKPGKIGLFNRAYSVPEAIETFLSDIYEPTDNPDRYTYIKGESTKGGTVYGQEEYGAPVLFYSFHATDPLFEKCVNAYDLVRLHLFGDTKSSEKQMKAFIKDDLRIREVIIEENAENVKDYFDKDEVKTDTPSTNTLSVEDRAKAIKEVWKSLEFDEKTKEKPANSIDNVLKILNGDPYFKDSIYFNEFEGMTVIKANTVFPWGKQSKFARNWTKNDVAGLRWYIEKFYKIKGKDLVETGFNTCMTNRQVHPVKEYLNSLEWDGVPRVDTLFIDYFGAEDNSYTRDVSRKTLAAAVRRIRGLPETEESQEYFDDYGRIKFDTTPVLIGSQGIGKSTFLSILAKNWFCDSYIDFASKEGYMMLQGNWIIEIGELAGFYGKENEQIKSFLSKSEDKFRKPYEVGIAKSVRQCVFFGTTNNEKFLKDYTGNRRFWPIRCEITKPTKSVFKDLKKEVDQIWAEACVVEEAGEELYLKDESAEIARKEQELRLEDDPWKEDIISFLRQEIPMDWGERSLQARKTYWHKDSLDEDFYFDEDENAPMTQRDKISVKEIWCELLQGDLNRLTKRDEKRIRQVLESLPGLESGTKGRIGKAYYNNNPISLYKIDQQFYAWAEKRDSEE